MSRNYDNETDNALGITDDYIDHEIRELRGGENIAFKAWLIIMGLAIGGFLSYFVHPLLGLIVVPWIYYIIKTKMTVGV